jgi:hypothetical protein
MADFKIVYAIVERGPKRYWLRIGMAFLNRDGSLNVRLDAVPLTGQLQIRDQAPPHDGEPVDPAAVRSSTATEGRAPSHLRKKAP